VLVIVRALWWPVAAAAVSGLAAWGVSTLVPFAPVKLLVGGIVGGIVYLVLTGPLLSMLLPHSITSRRPVALVLRVLGAPLRAVGESGTARRAAE
jgi:hypothetical protein